MVREVRNQTLSVHISAEIKSRLGSTTKVMACGRGRKGMLVDANWGGGGEMKSVCPGDSVVKYFLSWFL